MGWTRRAAIGGMAAALAGGAQAMDRPDAEPFTFELQNRVFQQRRMPFLAVYGGARPRLGFVAALHAVDPASATFKLVDTGFERVAPRRLILEGFTHDWGDNPRQIAALAARRTDPQADAFTRSESVFAAARALERGVPFRGGELGEPDLVDRLAASGFARQDLLNVMLIKVLDQDHNGGVFTKPEGPAFEAAFDRWAGILAATHGAPAPSVAQFRTWYQDRFGTALADDPDWRRRAWPGQPGLGGRIAQAQGLERDRFLLARIREAAASDPSVLVVYGGSHLASLWTALSADFGPPEIIGPEAA